MYPWSGSVPAKGAPRPGSCPPGDSDAVASSAAEAGSRGRHGPAHAYGSQEYSGPRKPEANDVRCPVIEAGLGQSGKLVQDHIQRRGPAVRPSCSVRLLARPPQRRPHESLPRGGKLSTQRYKCGLDLCVSWEALYGPRGRRLNDGAAPQLDGMGNTSAALLEEYPTLRKRIARQQPGRRWLWKPVIRCRDEEQILGSLGRSCSGDPPARSALWVFSRLESLMARMPHVVPWQHSG